MKTHRILVVSTTLAAVALGVCALAGCAGNGNVTTAIDNSVAAKVTFTSDDLQHASSISANHGDSDHGVECYNWLNSQLPAIQAALSPSTATNVDGVFSAFEQANVTVGKVQAGIPPALKLGFEMQCGPYVANVTGNINFLLARVAAGAAIVH